MRSLSSAAFAFLLTLASAFAQGPDARLAPPEPMALYTAGDYEGAIALGEMYSDGVGLATAARAALAIANLRDAPCLECLRRAERLARAAISADIQQQDAYVFLAAALGYEARILGIVRAYWGNHAERARAAIDTALNLSPRDPWALAASGAWHIEVVRSGGRVLGHALYGGDFDAGVAQFEDALAAGPGNPVIRFQFALALSGFNLETHRERVRALLEESVAMPPRTAYEREVRQRAQLLLRLLGAGNDGEYLEQVGRYQGYP